MAYINDWRVKGIYRVFIGEVSGDEIVEAVLEIEGDQRFDDLDYIINDFRRVDKYEVSERDIKTIVKIDKHAVKINSKIRIAIVATHEPIHEWAKLYCNKMHDSPYDCEVFNSMEKAEKWALSSSSQGAC